MWLITWKSSSVRLQYSIVLHTHHLLSIQRQMLRQIKILLFTHLRCCVICHQTFPVMNCNKSKHESLLYCLLLRLLKNCTYHNTESFCCCFNVLIFQIILHEYNSELLELILGILKGNRQNSTGQLWAWEPWLWLSLVLLLWTM